MDILQNGLHSLKYAIHNLKQLETASENEREFINILNSKADKIIQILGHTN